MSGKMRCPKPMPAAALQGFFVRAICNISMKGGILRVENLQKYYAKEDGMIRRNAGTTRAADGVSFEIGRGEVFVLAGESGSGKTTIARLILGSARPDGGRIFFEGAEMSESGDMARIRAGCQMIHQDPYDSIDPRMRIADIISEPLEIHRIGSKKDRERRVIEVLQEVRLGPAEEVAQMYPHMLSGGQRQRVVLARALAPKPKVILADEPVSMLDVSVRAEMLGLMRELQERHGISFLYITHDLATARHFGQRIAILYRGRIAETGPVESVLLEPKHPYTQALIDAIPEPDPENLGRAREIRILEPDGGADPVSGCRFRGRCPYAEDICAKEPELQDRGGGHNSACHVL